MQTATILPQQFLGMIKDEKYHMALAHLINAPGYEEYTAFYRNVGLREDQFLMLDSGLIEGDARPTEELIIKAQQINANEMVINDVFMDKDATLHTSWKALEKVEQSGHDIRIMGIPQGTSVAEWLECAEEMVKWGIDTIGVPKVLANLEPNGRMAALMKLQDFKKPEQQVHLLGCWFTPLEIKAIENLRRSKVIDMEIRGVDSAIAWDYAASGLSITDDERPQKKINFAAKTVDQGLLQRNIDIWKLECTELKETSKDSGIYRIL